MARGEIEGAVDELEILHAAIHRAFDFVGDGLWIEEAVPSALDAAVGAVGALERAATLRLERVASVAAQIRAEVVHPFVKARGGELSGVEDAERRAALLVRADDGGEWL